MKARRKPTPDGNLCAATVGHDDADAELAVRARHRADPDRRGLGVGLLQNRVSRRFQRRHGRLASIGSEVADAQNAGELPGHVIRNTFSPTGACWAKPLAHRQVDAPARQVSSACGKLLYSWIPRSCS